MDFAGSPEKIIQSWRKDITPDELSRTQEILKMFGFDRLYTGEGFPVSPSYKI
jgi:hypothetical protein